MAVSRRGEATSLMVDMSEVKKAYDKVCTQLRELRAAATAEIFQQDERHYGEWEELVERHRAEMEALKASQESRAKPLAQQVEMLTTGLKFLGIWAKPVGKVLAVTPPAEPKPVVPEYSFVNFVVDSLIGPCDAGRVNSMGDLLTVMRRRYKGRCEPFVISVDSAKKALEAIKRELQVQVARGTCTITPSRLEHLKTCHGGERKDLALVIETLSMIANGLDITGVEVDETNHMAYAVEVDCAEVEA